MPKGKKKTAAAEAPAVTKKTSTAVAFLLDRSGSMNSIKDATIEGFNAYVGLLKSDKDSDIDFTFLQFDSPHGIEKFCVAKPIEAVDLLTKETFVPRGGTPLIDACFKTIKALEAAVAKRKDSPKVIVCFQTDGEENSSNEYKWADLSKLIEEKQAAGWQFNFMGVGLTAYAQAAAMGISAASTVAYNSMNIADTHNAFAASANNVIGFASGALRSTAYSNEQKSLSGDVYESNWVSGTANPSPSMGASITLGGQLGGGGGPYDAAISGVTQAALQQSFDQVTQAAAAAQATLNQQWLLQKAKAIKDAAIKDFEL